LERMRTRPGTAAVLTEQLDAPGFHFLPAFLNASEADHILGAVKRLDTSAWVNSPGVAKRGTAFRAELLLSSDSLLPIVLKRFQSYLARVLGRAVDVSAVTKLHVMRYVGNKPAEGLHRDSSVYYEMEGRPLHHMTTMLHLTGQAPSVPAEEAGATYFPDVGPGPGVLVPPSKGALLAFDESVPHAVGHKAPAAGERVSIFMPAAPADAFQGQVYPEVGRAMAAAGNATDRMEARELVLEVFRLGATVARRRLETADKHATSGVVFSDEVQLWIAGHSRLLALINAIA